MNIQAIRMRVWRRCICFLCMFVILVGMLFIVPSMPVYAEDEWPEGPEIESGAAIVMEANTGTVLYEKNCHEHCFPASITKVMTALLAVENASMDETVTFSSDAVFGIDPGSSSIARDVGEEMTMEETLYGMMLESANECANAIAEHVSGSCDAFVDMMNTKAKELGCTDTHFCNPSGLPDEDHYTSCYDMALIANEAIHNDLFRTIISTKQYIIPPTNKHDEETPLNNHHQMISKYKGPDNLYEYAIGGKTGYTVAAGNTLVTFAEKDGMLLTCVVMKSESHYKDTRTLFDYCFSHFQVWDIDDNQTQQTGQKTSADRMFGTEGSFVSLDSESEIVLPSGVDFSAATCEINRDNLPEGVVAALNYSYAGHVVGHAEIEKSFPVVKAYIFGKDQEEETQEELSFPQSVLKKVMDLRDSFLSDETEVQISREDLILLLICLGVAVGAIIAVIVIIRNSLRSRRRRKSREKDRKKTGGKENGPDQKNIKKKDHQNDDLDMEEFK